MVGLVTSEDDLRKQQDSSYTERLSFPLRGGIVRNEVYMSHYKYVEAIMKAC
jgi:hypothetical protein